MSTFKLTFPGWAIHAPRARRRLRGRHGRAVACGRLRHAAALCAGLDRRRMPRSCCPTARRSIRPISGRASRRAMPTAWPACATSRRCSRSASRRRERPNGQVVLRLERLPDPATDPEIDLLLLVGDRMSLSLGEYRVNLHGGHREFSGSPGRRPPRRKPAAREQRGDSRTRRERNSQCGDHRARVPAATRIDQCLAQRADAPAAQRRQSIALPRCALRIDAWARAWSQRDMDAYVGAYTPDFAGRGRTACRSNAWVEQRRDAHHVRSRSISVEIDRPELRRPRRQGVATFTQRYRGDTIHRDQPQAARAGAWRQRVADPGGGRIAVSDDDRIDSGQPAPKPSPRPTPGRSRTPVRSRWLLLIAGAVSWRRRHSSGRKRADCVARLPSLPHWLRPMRRRRQSRPFRRIPPPRFRPTRVSSTRWCRCWPAARICSLRRRACPSSPDARLLRIYGLIATSQASAGARGSPAAGPGPAELRTGAARLCRPAGCARFAHRWLRRGHRSRCVPMPASACANWSPRRARASSPAAGIARRPARCRPSSSASIRRCDMRSRSTSRSRDSMSSKIPPSGLVLKQRLLQLGRQARAGQAGRRRSAHAGRRLFRHRAHPRRAAA